MGNTSEKIQVRRINLRVSAQFLRRLQRAASRRGESMTAIIRRAVDQYLNRVKL